jgi:hypothetical protein
VRYLEVVWSEGGSSRFLPPSLLGGVVQAVTVTGRFVNEAGQPLTDTVKFIPSKIWVDEGEHSYPTLAPEVELVNGNFSVELSRTDTTDLPWHYTVICPVGKWTIRITGDGPLRLLDLLPKRFAT